MIFVVGMAMEACLLRGRRVVVGAGDAESLARKIDAAMIERPEPLLSFGVAGGLDPRLRPGDLVVADSVWSGGEIFDCDPAWVERLRDLAGGPPGPRRIAAQDDPAATVAAKSTLHKLSGAAAVDMESHVAARAARRHNVPFAVWRVVADPAGRDLPSAALAPLRADGRPDLPPILARLARRPGQIAALLALSRDLNAAMAALRAKVAAL